MEDTNNKFNKSLEALDLQGILLLMNVLAQRALFLQMNPPTKKPKSGIITPDEKKVIF